MDAAPTNLRPPSLSQAHAQGLEASMPDLQPPRSMLPGARRYAAVVVGIVLLLALATLAASVALDPYRVLWPNRGNLRNFEPNERATKLAQLSTSGCAQFDGFVLGASRANFYPTASVEAAFGGRWYNMTVAGETMAGMRRRGLWLMDHCRPTHLVITVDPLQFGWGPDYGTDLLRGEPPETGGPSRMRFLLRYLFLPPHAIWLAAREVLFPRPILYEINLADGTHFQRDADLATAAAHSPRRGHLAVVCHAPEPIRRDNMAANLALLEDLAAQAKARGVRLTALAHPVNQNQLAAMEFPQVAAWAEAVARITDRLLFFGGFNALSMDDSRFFDASHFDELLGQQVMQLAAGMTTTPPDGLIGLYDAATAPLLRERLMANLAGRAAACARR
jgi:hypothetical protein